MRRLVASVTLLTVLAVMALAVGLAPVSGKSALDEVETQDRLQLFHDIPEAEAAAGYRIPLAVDAEGWRLVRIQVTPVGLARCVLRTSIVGSRVECSDGGLKPEPGVHNYVHLTYSYRDIGGAIVAVHVPFPPRNADDMPAGWRAEQMEIDGEVVLLDWVNLGWSERGVRASWIRNGVPLFATVTLGGDPSTGVGGISREILIEFLRAIR